MKYFWTFFWTYLLVLMMTYVVSSMNNAHFDITASSIISVAITIVLYIFPFILKNEEGENAH